MKTLTTIKAFGQMINKYKNTFNVYNKVVHVDTQVEEHCTSISEGKCVLTYLECSIGHARKIKSHFTEILKNV